MSYLNQCCLIATLNLLQNCNVAVRGNWKWVRAPCGSVLIATLNLLQNCNVAVRGNWKWVSTMLECSNCYVKSFAEL